MISDSLYEMSLVSVIFLSLIFQQYLSWYRDRRARRKQEELWRSCWEMILRDDRFTVSKNALPENGIKKEGKIFDGIDLDTGQSVIIEHDAPLYDEKDLV